MLCKTSVRQESRARRPGREREESGKAEREGERGVRREREGRGEREGGQEERREEEREERGR